MPSTLPLTGNGNITMNSTPADAQIKLTDANAGNGNTLSIIGSNGAAGNNGGGNIVLSPGAKTGTGSGGFVGIGTASPTEMLEVAGNIKLASPATERVWTTQKVYNVLDYGAIPLVTRTYGQGGTILGATLSDASISTLNVSIGDMLWIHNFNQDCGAYTITNVVNGMITIGSAFPINVPGGVISWKVTSAASSVDNTGHFNTALLAAQTTENGGIVYVPNGYFMFNNNANTTILVPSNVTLRGMWNAPAEWMTNYWLAGVNQGPVLLCLSNQGNSGDATHPSFVTLSGGTDFLTFGGTGGSSTIEGLTIFYPIQWLNVDSGNPDTYIVQHYPFCIEFQAGPTPPLPSTSGVECDNRAINLQLVNPYQGIKIVALPGPLDGGTGRNHLSNIYGCPLITGILIDNLWDVSYIEKINFNPYVMYLYNALITDTLRAQWNTFLVLNLTAIKIQQVVWAVINEVFAIFAHNGIWITSDPTTGAAQGLFGSNIQFDMADCGIYVNLPDNATADLELTNVRITCGTNPGVVTDTAVYRRNHCVFADPAGNNGSCLLMLNNGTFMSYLGGNTIDWEIPDFLKISNFIFIDHDQAAISAGVYATAGRIQIHGCLFQHNSLGFTKCINITSGASMGIIYGNDYRDYSSPVSSLATSQTFSVSGNVGIGTVSPTDKLTIKDTQELSVGDGKGNGGFSEIQIKAPGGAILLGLESKTPGNEFIRWANEARRNWIQSFEATAGNPQTAALTLGVGTTRVMLVVLKSKSRIPQRFCLV